MRQDFETGIIMGQALEQLRSHESRIGSLEDWRREGGHRQEPGRGQRAALVTALWTAAAGTAWHADSIAARLLGLIGR